jgi:anaerobic dimethyl sulfoxide reductase subunit B (iron-sulfur subunit)
VPERKVAQTYEPVKPEAARLHPQQRRLHRLPRLRDRLQGQERPAAGAALPPRDVRRGRHFPDVFAYKVNMSCNHCAEPACLPTCPTGAIWKREEDGIVDIDSTLCIGCRRCEAACPYGAPQWTPKTDGQEVQHVRRRDRCRPQALLRDGLHDARARHRPDRQELPSWTST